MKYKACGFFVSRTPLLPIENYLDMFGSSSYNVVREKIFSLFREPVLEEALAVASLESHQAMGRLNNINRSKSVEQILSTLIKYYIRLTTRPTPYGIFSGVSIGTFGRKSVLTVSSITGHKKRARVDTEWLYEVIKKIESNREIRKLLRVRFNDYIYIDGDRLEKPTTTFLQLNTAAGELGTSIKYTRQVERVKDMAHDLVALSDLLSNLSAQNPAVPPEKIEVFLNQLFENEYLISELRPPLVNTDALSYVIAALERIEHNQEATSYLLQLKSIASDISTYNSVPTGNDHRLFSGIIGKMKTLHTTKNYLQVDMKIAMDSNELSDTLKVELEEFVNAMLRITPEDQNSDEYTDYIDRFLEKYGTAAEVPVLELLDTDKGLGLPSYYYGAVRRPTPKQQKSEKEMRFERLMRRKLTQALKENSSILELTDQDIDSIAGERQSDVLYSREDFPSSFELFLIAHPDSDCTQEQRTYCFTLAPAMASDGVGKSIGRFRDMFSETELSCFRSQAAELQKSFPDCIIAEISEIPERGRTSNICTNHSDCDYQIMLSTNSCIGKQKLSINDLYISVDLRSKQFRIKSKSMNKRVLVTASSMLNPTFGSSAVRFLKEVSSNHRLNILNTISCITTSEYEYTPRITYKRIILKPATWIMSRETLGLQDNTEDHFIQCLQNFRKKWDVPRFVYLAQYDNRLLFDLDNPLHIHEIHRLVKKENSPSLQLMEMTCNFNEYAAQDSSGRHYVTEVVVPFSLSPGALEAKHERISPIFFPTASNTDQNAMETDPRKQLLLPGCENWLYFKLYGYIKRRAEILPLLYKLLGKR